MNRDKYEEAWTNLLAARKSGTYEQVQKFAEVLARESFILDLLSKTEGIVEKIFRAKHSNPCSHFTVVNGHCINCHEIVAHSERIDGCK